MVQLILSIGLCFLLFSSGSLFDWVRVIVLFMGVFYHAATLFFTFLYFTADSVAITPLERIFIGKFLMV